MAPHCTLHDPARWPAQRDALRSALRTPPTDEEGLCHLLHLTSHAQLAAEEFGRSTAVATVESVDPEWWSATLPFIIQLALRSADLCPPDETSPLRYLPPGERGSVRLSRVHVASVLALAFFDAIGPPVNADPKWDLPGHLTCRSWFGVGDVYGGDECDEQKLACLCVYFKRMRELFGREVSDDAAMARLAGAPATDDALVISRLVLPKDAAAASGAAAAATWLECDAPLRALRVVEAGGIEEAAGALQADFANEYIGGGVLCGGNVQEEIRFSVSPECLVSLLLCGRMREHEAVLLSGVRQYASYSGYGHRFTCEGAAPWPQGGGAAPAGELVLAIDAVPYAYLAGGAASQYSERGMLRELKKLRAGLGEGGGYADEPKEAEAEAAAEAESGPPPAKKTRSSSRHASSSASLVPPAGGRRPFATGNWGCGVFGGDARLKALLQWMAASRAGRDVLYYPFGDPRIAGLKETAERLLKAKVTVGQLGRALFKSGDQALSHGRAFAVVEAELLRS